jgi:hypothetical protein
MVTRPNCSRIDCGSPARVLPVLTFRAIDTAPDAVRAKATISLPLCDRHAVADPALYVSDESWATIVAGVTLSGRVAPDRSSIEVEFLPMVRP